VERAKRALNVVIAATLAMAVLAPPATAEDPLFVDWTTMLPSFTTQYDPSSANDCTAGRFTCVDKTIREMERRFDPLAAACDHNAVFALSYLRTTQVYEEAASEPGFFDDPYFVNHEDAVFARYYFDAYDAWAAGRSADVPGAWKVALNAAQARAVSGTGNLFLGMNAHVNRDLPFVLADIGLVAPDGTSRKPDHDQVNVFLNRVIDPLLAEEAARFDPAMDDAGALPLMLGYTSTFQMLAAWREDAWRNAERLVNAPDAASRAAVAASIESAATLMASTIKTATSYLWPLQTSASRDAYCMANRS
jgi:hypothetical protein